MFGHTLDICSTFTVILQNVPPQATFFLAETRKGCHNIKGARWTYLISMFIDGYIYSNTIEVYTSVPFKVMFQTKMIE